MTRQEIIDELASWEKFAAEREAYPREQYEADKAKAIAEGVDPRLIMSYFETLSYMAWEAEKEREWEEAEAYDEEWDEDDVRQMREAYAELEREKAVEREIAAEVAERDEIIEFVNIAEEAAMAELAAFGYWDATEPLTGREIFNEMHAVIGGSREMAFEPTESGAKQLVL